MCANTGPWGVLHIFVAKRLIWRWWLFSTREICHFVLVKIAVDLKFEAIQDLHWGHTCAVTWLLLSSSFHSYDPKVIFYINPIWAVTGAPKKLSHIADVRKTENVEGISLVECILRLNLGTSADVGRFWIKIKKTMRWIIIAVDERDRSWWIIHCRYSSQ